MAQHSVQISDLTGELILNEKKAVRLVVRDHPNLKGSPVELLALSNEVVTMQDDRLTIAVVDVYWPELPEPERFVLSAAHFDLLARTGSMAVVLATAQSARGRRARGEGRPQPSRNGKVDYSSSAHAGKPHRGQATEAERAYVREHLDEVNVRLRREGLREIDLYAPAMIRRYGLRPPEH
jgi:hypothetical protein